MDTHEIRITKPEDNFGVLELRLDRPKVLNALDRGSLDGLRHAFTVEARKSACRAVMLTGEGRAFCAGADVRGFAGGLMDPHAAAAELPLPILLHEMLLSIRRTPKPVLAAVNGPAVGAGFPLAAAADLIVAAESAYFSLGYLGIGLSPDGGSTHLLPRTLGPHKTIELMTLGGRLAARDALAAGLVARVFPDDRFYEEATEVARQLARLPTQAFSVGKELVQQTFERPVEAQLEHETRGVMTTSRSRDFAEGVRAFVEKREPRFEGG